MRLSRLPAGGANLFQLIKAKKAEAAAKGINILNLAIGQPAGPALLSARKAAAEAVMSDQEKWHEYNDNGCVAIPDFARRFVKSHVSYNFNEEKVDYLPIPGIKPMLGLIILACGSSLKEVATTTRPGYPTPKDWCRYLGKKVFEPEMNPENGFRFDPESLERSFISELFHGKIGLAMTNYPHNPSGAVASKWWWEDVCDICEESGIRIINDSAYSKLSYGNDSCCLSEVAPDFPDLSWAEAFSISKEIRNGTGWRVGAMVGSPDFIGDIKIIKGNTDSGFVSPMAAGALFALENDQENIAVVRETYERRASLLCRILKGANMRLAIEPRAGFFTLWEVPKYAFGREIKNAEDFNFAMIENTGVVGVHFHPYIRYAVASADVEAIENNIRDAFVKANVSY